MPDLAENVSQIIEEFFTSEEYKMSTDVMANLTEITSTTENILTSILSSAPSPNLTTILPSTSTQMVTNSTTLMSTSTPSPTTTSAPLFEDQLEEIRNTVDTFFVLINSCVVFFLQAGFAFLEAGCVRSKNTTNILIKNILDSLLGALAFWLFGYMIANSHGNSFMGSDPRFICLLDIPASHYSFWFFGFVFCATASTIVSGAVAERCELTAYFAYSTVISTIVYPVVAHWVWTSEGWLAVNGYVDFAGSGVVHHLGGVCGLVGAIFLGPRIGRFNKDGTISDIPGHSVSLAALGGFILMFGFFSFNGATNASISSYEDRDVVQRAVINTMIGGTSSGLVTLLSFRFSARKKWSLLSTMNGILTGMIATCAFCNSAAPWATFLVGILASFTYAIVHYAMIWFRIDDPLDAVAVHSGGGIVGVLATPFVLGSGGVFDAENSVTAMHQIWSQVVGLLVITAWAGGVSAILFYILKLNNKLRVSEEIEVKGADIIKHGESAYPAGAWQELQYANPDTIDSLHPVMRNNIARNTEGKPEEGMREGWGSVKKRIHQQWRRESLDLDHPQQSVKPLTFRKIDAESLESGSESSNTRDNGLEMQGVTNHGFEYSVNLGGTEETDMDDLDSLKPRGIVESIVEHERTIEFNNSKESTMI